MDNSFALRIRDVVASQGRAIRFPPVSDKDVEETEAQLKFSIPPLLRFVYQNVGNGGFGPGRGGSLIGLKGGYASDFGTLVETYEQLKRDRVGDRKQFWVGLLPFCEWGDNIFSCVDCLQAHHPIHLVEDIDLFPKKYTLEDFFRMFVDGVDILAVEAAPQKLVEVTNPFTGKKTQVALQERK